MKTSVKTTYYSKNKRTKLFLALSLLSQSTIAEEIMTPKSSVSKINYVDSESISFTTNNIKDNNGIQISSQSLTNYQNDDSLNIDSNNNDYTNLNSNQNTVFVDATDVNNTINNTNYNPAQAEELGTITVTGYQTRNHNDLTSYEMNKKELEQRPAGNSDISSVLKNVPGVRVLRSAQTSENMGTISPTEISIAGGQTYQNSFLVDGVSINNNIDPAGSGSWLGRPSGRSQGIALDTSLIDNIKVQDSNIDAEYGNFNGGVVEVETKRPEKDLSFTIKHRYTNGNSEKSFPHSLTSYHIYGDEAEHEDFLTSTAADGRHPVFIKNFTTITAESKINDQVGVVAQFARKQSVIPLTLGKDEYYKSYNDGAWATTIDHDNVKKKSKEYNYNAMAKVYYDPNPDLSLSFSYTYAPDYKRTFLEGAKPDHFYDDKHGGHILSQETSLKTSLGTLSNTLSYTNLSDEQVAHGYDSIKYWAASDSKNWSNWAAWAREGGYAPSIQTQESLNEKIKFEFNPFNIGITEHNLKVGAELNYNDKSFKYTKDFYASVKNEVPMTKEQQARCLQTDLEWCDPAKAYDPRNFRSKKDYPDAIVDEDRNGRTIQVWPYGQYLNTVYLYQSEEPIHLVDKNAGLFLSDNIKVKTDKYGEWQITPGLRLDYDGFLSKFNISPRFAIDYGLPHNNTNPEFATVLSAGYNRYYGSNVISGTIFDRQIKNLNVDIKRSDPSTSWDDVQQSKYVCKEDTRTKSYKHINHDKAKAAGLAEKSIDEAGGYDAFAADFWEDGRDTDCIVKYENDEKFNQWEQNLKTPYSDEFNGSITQNLGAMQLQTKYIHRNYRDQIRMGYTDELGWTDPDDEYYRVITNRGKYQVDQVSISLKNREPFEIKNSKHTFGLTYDWQKRRGSTGKYNTYLRETDDDWILFNGELMRKSQMPESNRAIPYQIGLTTDSEWNMLGGKWHLNNVFTYKRSVEDYGSDTKLRKTGAEMGFPDQSYVYYYRRMRIPSKFNWDMKLGAEYTVNKDRDSALFFDLDVSNVLNKKSTALVTYNNSKEVAIPTYDPGRQVWLEFGYRF